MATRPSSAQARRYLLHLLRLVLGVGFASASPAFGAHVVPADTAMLGGVVLTLDVTDATATALAIRDGAIVAVGTDAEIRAFVGPHTRLIALGGRTATPGLIDTHGHYAETAGDEQRPLVALDDARSVAEIVRRVTLAVRGARPGEWIRGSGWDAGKLAEGRAVRAADLDAVAPSNPVFLMNTTGHFGTANSVALGLAGITAASADPPAGTFERDGGGALTGVLKEAGMDAVLALIPPPTLVEREAGIRKIVAALHREGITAIKEMGSPAVWDAYEDLVRQGRLDERVCMLWYAGTTLESAAATLAEIRRHPRPPATLGDGRLVACGAKIFMDGSAVARTAWAYDPWYRSEHEVDGQNTGYPALDPEVYRAQVRLLHRAGISVGTHAIGERAMDWVVDTYRQVLEETPTIGLRHTVIHAYLPTAHAIETLAMLQRRFDAGYPEIQAPFLWWLGGNYPGALGPERLARLMPLASYVRAGVRFAGGSDYNVAPYPPRYGLWASVARETRDGSHPFGTAEAVGIKVALRSYTTAAAPLLFLEDRIGSLEVGKRADIAVWDRNPYQVATAALKDMRCELTLVDGKVVYRAPAQPKHHAAS